MSKVKNDKFYSSAPSGTDVHCPHVQIIMVFQRAVCMMSQTGSSVTVCRNIYAHSLFNFETKHILQEGCALYV